MLCFKNIELYPRQLNLICSTFIKSSVPYLGFVAPIVSEI